MNKKIKDLREKRNDQRQRGNKGNNEFRALVMTFMPCMIIICITLIVFFKVIELSYIPSESMEPTLMTGDIAIYNRLAYVKNAPKRGDVVTLIKDGVLYSKRIIGEPGDLVKFDSGYVYINGEKLDESEYIDDSIETNCLHEFEVPEDAYFVLGDNREVSSDSRYWDDPYVFEDDIQAKMFFVIPLHTLK